MTAKRALVMTPGTTPKRRRTMPRNTTVVYRGLKPEMKTLVTSISHTSTTNSFTFINSLAEGAAQNQRIGARVKVHFIEVQLRCSAPLRIELLHGNNLTTPSHGIDSFVERDIFNVLEREYLNPTVSGQTYVINMRHKLPYGIIGKYSGATGADIEKGKLWLVCNAVAATSVVGNVRIWYTDN